ncbi:MAG: chromate transporter [Clostridia bacterium]|nr:chromate transporter [Clostridia bacterium]
MGKLGRLFFTFLKIGAFTFGGGYAMIALLETEFIDRKKWMTREEFLDMVAIAESTPGPVAINSATYIGYKVAGVTGAALATLAVSLPSFGIIYLISLFFERFLALEWVARAFRGIQVCVVYLILTAGLDMLKSLRRDALSLVIFFCVLAVMTAFSIFSVGFSSIFYILISGLAGLTAYSLRRLSGKGANGK